MRILKKIAVSLLLIATTTGAFFNPNGMPTQVYASDQPIAVEKEPEGAVRGKVRIQALRAETYDYDIEIMLSPYSDEAICYTFVLNEDNEYKITENVMVGKYRVIAYPVSEEDLTNINVRVEATSDVEVKENAAEIPVVVALEGDKDFVKDYSGLTVYKDDVKGYLSGIITEKEAKEYVEKDIENQHTGLTAEELGINYGDVDGEIDYTSPKEQEEAADIKPEEEMLSKNRALPVKFIIPVVVIVLAGIIIFVIKKRK